ncbi:MAG: sarcosine oxidase subunit gamma [Alphaproteobacteria bacterium]|nr:sarcosine oxidase subunit gamma [Alphaproteobacteria bacterium]
MADPLDGRARLDLPGRLLLAPCAPAARFVLRGGADVAARAGAAFGATPSLEACRASVEGERAALWLGPDEWLLLAPRAEEDAAEDALRGALAGAPHALVRVSDRHAALTASGPCAEALLAAGCPLDLDPAAFPEGMCTRTLLGKVEIVLWRHRPLGFRVEMRRSFAAHAWDLLAEAAREHAVP